MHSILLGGHNEKTFFFKVEREMKSFYALGQIEQIEQIGIHKIDISG